MSSGTTNGGTIQEPMLGPNSAAGAGDWETVAATVAGASAAFRACMGVSVKDAIAAQHAKRG